MLDTETIQTFLEIECPSTQKFTRLEVEYNFYINNGVTNCHNAENFQLKFPFRVLFSEKMKLSVLQIDQKQNGSTDANGGRCLYCLGPASKCYFYSSRYCFQNIQL